MTASAATAAHAVARTAWRVPSTARRLSVLSQAGADAPAPRVVTTAAPLQRGVSLAIAPAPSLGSRAPRAASTISQAATRTHTPDESWRAFSSSSQTIMLRR